MAKRFDLKRALIPYPFEDSIKKSKSTQSTAGSNLLSKNRSREELLNNPSDDTWRKTLINTMYFWGKQPDSLEAPQFCFDYNIPFTTFLEWDNKYQDVRAAYKEIKLMIACRRRIGSMKKELDHSPAYRDMHIYDPAWSESLKKEEESKAIPAINLTACLCKPKITSAEEMRKQYESIE